MVSPHFPPDTSAAAHRLRLLAPHLPAHGWEPTVVAVDARDYEGRLDPGLARLVPPTLRVVRARAWPASWTRRAGIGDLGLRAMAGLWRTCARLLSDERFDALFITIYPTYPALLGPLLKRRFRVPFVLDYQDPWIGAWGDTVGGGPGGTPDLKSRLSRRVARWLEPLALHAADAVTAVSHRTYEEICQRHPELRRRACAAIPLGAEPADFEHARAARRPNPAFDPRDGDLHLAFVGTLLPLGIETLRAALAALALARDRRPDLYGRIRWHFVGTSNQTRATGAPRALPVAREFGVADRVTEIAARVDYLDAVTVHADAGAILLLGSSEAHYTPSKLYPALLSGRPILAVYHQDSSAVEILKRAADPDACRVVTYSDAEPAASRVEAILSALVATAESAAANPPRVARHAIGEYSARALAGALAKILDAARAPR